jgi:two-component system, OmpR family, response regulator RpaB
MINMKTDISKLDVYYVKKNTKPFSVLLVDDEEYILAFVGIKLKLSGYQVLTAGDGIEALEILKNMIPDLVIIDLIMPRMDGPSLLKEIRKFSLVPVIILSAVDSQDIVIRELRQGADDYIHKPFNPDELVTRIEAIRHRRDNSGSAV